MKANKYKVIQCFLVIIYFEQCIRKGSDMKFKDLLRKLRKSKGKTIRELARESGVSASYISMLENGLLANDPSEETISKLATGVGDEQGILLSCSKHAKRKGKIR